MTVMIIAIAMLLDPIRLILAVIGGGVSKTWLHVAIASVVTAIVVEAILSSTQITRTFELGTFIVGVFAAGLWASLTFWIKQRRAAKK